MINYINPFATASIQEQEPYSIKKGLNDIRVEVGSSNMFVNGWRNFVSIPQKLLLWNSSINSGNVSAETIDKMKEFLHENDLHDVFVSVNQYKPQEVWKRIFTNPKTSLLSKMTGGIVSGIFETLSFPKYTGFPGDHYNPFSNSVHIYSNNTAIALHECGHAKDFNSRENPILYISTAAVPYVGTFATLYQEYLASNHAVNFLREKKLNTELASAFKLLVPAYATYCTSAILPSLSEKLFILTAVCDADPNLCAPAFSALFAEYQAYMMKFWAIMLTGHVAGRILAANAHRFTKRDESEPVSA